jgi:hypothetical protein
MPDDNGTPTPTPQQTTDLPEWARQAISTANAEAAAKRVELRTKNDELTAANSKITEIGAEKDAAVAAKAAADAALLKLTVALAAGIPGDKAAAVAERLRGNTKEEIEADAKSLVDNFGVNLAPSAPSATDPSQGQGGNANSGTPEADMANFLKGEFSRLLG